MSIRRGAALAAAALLLAPLTARADTFFSYPMTTAVGDLDGDGVGDLVVVLQFESPVVAYSGLTGARLWRTDIADATNAWPVRTGAAGTPGVLVQSLSGDGGVAVTLVSATGSQVWHRDWGDAGRSVAVADLVPGGGDDVGVWVTPANVVPAATGVQSAEVLDGATGATYAFVTTGVSLSASAPEIVGDLDGDGGRDVVWPETLLDTRLHGYASDGRALWTSDAPLPGILRVVPTGDLTGDGRPDLVAVAADTLGARTATAVSGADGHVLWSRPGDAVFAAGDVDGDGSPDLLVGQTGSASTALRAYDALGGLLYDTTVPFRGLRALGDVTGDGVADLLAGLAPGNAGQAVVDGATGTVLRTGTERRLGASVDCAADDTATVAIANGVATVRTLDGATGTQLWSTQTDGYRDFVSVLPLTASTGACADVAIVSIHPDGYWITVVEPSGTVRVSAQVAFPYV